MIFETLKIWSHFWLSKLLNIFLTYVNIMWASLPDRQNIDFLFSKRSVKVLDFSLDNFFELIESLNFGEIQMSLFVGQKSTEQKVSQIELSHLRKQNRSDI